MQRRPLCRSLVVDTVDVSAVLPVVLLLVLVLGGLLLIAAGPLG